MKMKLKKSKVMEATERHEEEIDSETECDKELQIAFEKGLLKPGVVQELDKGKIVVNNAQGLLNKLEEIKLDLPWIETLDFSGEPAALAPELETQLDAHKEKGEQCDYSNDDLIYDDFAREMYFYRLGQAAVIEGIQRLHDLGIPTKRPEDYLAEMSKSDDHMHKVRLRLQVKENEMLVREKSKKMRDLKKYGKKVQVEKQLLRQKEKKNMLEQLKKYRKGKATSLDFLDDNLDKTSTTDIIGKKKKEMKLVNERRLKNKAIKYGHRGWKRNTAQDLDGPIDAAGRQHKNSFGKKPTTNQNRNRNKSKNQRRPGKDSRQESKKVVKATKKQKFKKK